MASGERIVDHCEQVVATLQTVGKITDPEVLAVGWLHEVPSCTLYTYKYIEDTFSRSVGFGVKLISPSSEGRDSQINDVVQLRKHKANRYVTVKLADRIVNLMKADTWDYEKRMKYAVSSLGILWATAKPMAPDLWSGLCSLVMPIILNARMDMNKNRVCDGCHKHRKTWWSGYHHYCVKCRLTQERIQGKVFPTIRWLWWVVTRSWRAD